MLQTLTVLYFALKQKKVVFFSVMRLLWQLLLVEERIILASVIQKFTAIGTLGNIENLRKSTLQTLNAFFFLRWHFIKFQTVNIRINSTDLNTTTFIQVLVMKNKYR